MNRILYIDDSQEYVRAALVEDGRLCEIHSEVKQTSAQAESLYYGRIQAIRPSIGAAFVDIGDELNAFLPLESGMNLRCGDMLIVQGVAKQATDTKGLRISAKINLPGKWLVLIPGEEGVRISKKVKDPQMRGMLEEFGKRICPDGCALIIRTASEEVTQDLLQDEVNQLFVRWQEILKRTAGMRKPGIVYRREWLHMRLVRDLNGLDRIVVNREHCFRELLAEKEAMRIPQETQIEWFEERNQLIFDRFGIEAQIDKALKKRVWLPCGGYLIIDCCEALTVIDVNSGKMILGRDPEETALKVNLEAAEEIAKQIRLRDIGGIVVIDFIDMKNEESRKALIYKMKMAVTADRAQVNVEGLTRLGLLEMTRKRVHAQLHKAVESSCSYCSGTGLVLSSDEVARRAFRQVRRQVISGQRGPFVVRCAPSAANALLSMRNPMKETTVYVCAAAGRHLERFEVEQIGEGQPLPKEAAAMNVCSDL